MGAADVEVLDFGEAEDVFVEGGPNITGALVDVVGEVVDEQEAFGGLGDWVGVWDKVGLKGAGRIGPSVDKVEQAVAEAVNGRKGEGVIFRRKRFRATANGFVKGVLGVVHPEAQAGGRLPVGFCKISGVAVLGVVHQKVNVVLVVVINGRGGVLFCSRKAQGAEDALELGRVRPGEFNKSNAG